MILTSAVTAVQVLILFNLNSQYVQAETITGSLFEIQIATKLPLDDWANEEVEDPEPYAQWDPTCYKFFEFTKSTGNEIGKRLVGCHSASGADGNTQLKIYLAISPDKLISEKQELCLREAYKKAFDDWKAAMSASFQIRPEQIQFSSIFKRVKLNAQMISGTVNEGSPEVQPYEGVPDYEFRLKVKKFLLPWMRSINAQFPLISISPRWKVDSDSQLSVKIWFDVTGKSDEMQYGLFSDHMNAMTKSSQGPFKLAEVLEEGYPEILEYTESLFTRCQTVIANAKIEPKTLTGSAFEIELEINQNHLAFAATKDENHYYGRSPICDQLIDATVSIDDVIRDNLMGCRSNRTGAKTQLTVYMALPLAYLTAESITPCKTKFFAQWKIAISKHFEIHADNVQFLSTTRLVNLQAIAILGNVKKGKDVIASSDLLSERDESDLKEFLITWMQSMDEQNKLVSFAITSGYDDTAAVELDLLFDVTSQKEINMNETLIHLSVTANKYEGLVKLTDCKLTIPNFPETTDERFTGCENVIPSGETITEKKKENGSGIRMYSLTTIGLMLSLPLIHRCD